MKCGFFQAQKLPPAPRLLANSGLFYIVLSGLAEACGMQMGKGYEGIYAFFFSFKCVHRCMYTASSVMQPDTHSYLHTPVAPFTFYPSICVSSVFW